MIQIKYALIKIRMPDKKHCRLNTSVWFNPHWAILWGRNCLYVLFWPITDIPMYYLLLHHKNSERPLCRLSLFLTHSLTLLLQKQRMQASLPLLLFILINLFMCPREQDMHAHFIRRLVNGACITDNLFKGYIVMSTVLIYNY